MVCPSSGARIDNDRTRLAYSVSERSRISMSALRWACHLSISAAPSEYPVSNCAVPNCRQTSLKRSRLAIDDSGCGTKRRLRRSRRERKLVISLHISFERRGGPEIRPCAALRGRCRIAARAKVDLQGQSSLASCQQVGVVILSPHDDLGRV